MWLGLAPESAVPQTDTRWISSTTTLCSTTEAEAIAHRHKEILIRNWQTSLWEVICANPEKMHPQKWLERSPDSWVD